jgi:ribonucleotide reductase alpha subunit
MSNMLSPATIEKVATAFASNANHKKNLIHYMQNKWFIPASPVINNAPTRKKSSKLGNMRPTAFEKQPGMPISCFLNFVDDTINGSNLCSEIALPTEPDRSDVCCLSYVNLGLLDEWHDTSMIGDIAEMLDNVIEYFILNAPPELKVGQSHKIWSTIKQPALMPSIGVGFIEW